MESKECQTFSVVGSGSLGDCTAFHIFSKLCFNFFIPSVLIQDPAHRNNFMFPAMVLRLLLCLVCTCLHWYKLASLWPKSRSSHNSVSERWLTSFCRMHTRGNHLPCAAGQVTDQHSQCWYHVWHSSGTACDFWVTVWLSQLDLTVPSAHSTNKPVTTHIGHSIACQTEVKGVQTVTVQYWPSGRAEDQVARPMRAAGAWPVRPTAPAGPGKQITYYI